MVTSLLKPSAILLTILVTGLFAPLKCEDNDAGNNKTEYITFLSAA
jgi:hypothetical protein